MNSFAKITSGSKRVSKRSILLAVLAIAAAGFGFSPATAHHSFSAVFDIDQPFELEGVVTRVEWRNPHVWFYVDVQVENGETEAWAFELGSPNALVRRGWSHRTLNAGDRITVTGARARNGSLRGAVLSVTLPSGESLFGAQRPIR